MTTDPAGREQPGRRTPRRWPGWVYGQGGEPDVRFTLANERTFLAWIRTALALLAAGVAVDALDAAPSAAVETLLTGLLIALGLVCAVAAWLRWARAERALRLDEALPGLNVAAWLAGGVVVVAVILLAAL